jgi:hypothetical protein
MKKLFALVLMLPIALISQEDSRFGVSLGFGTSEYDFTELNLDTSKTKTIDSSHSTQYLGLDYGFGNHSFAVTTAVADVEVADETGNYFDDYYYPTRSMDLEFDDFNLTYTYKLSAKWQVGIGYNELNQTHDRTYSNDVDYAGIGYDDNNSYTWTYGDINEVTSDGLTAFAGYVQPFSNKLFGVARIGYAQQDYSAKGSWSDIISGLSPELDACLAQNVCPTGYVSNNPITAGLNGYGFQGDYTLEGDASAVVVGFGFVWVLSPKNTISFDYAVRSFDYGELTLSDSSIATGYFTGGDAQVGAVDSTPFEREVEEEFGFFSVKWRYKLN